MEFDKLTLFSGIVVALVAAVRRQWPWVDGWKVPVLAAGVALGVVAWEVLSHPGTSLRTILIEAPVVWLIAVGGNSWAQKLQDRKMAKQAELVAKAEPIKVDVEGQRPGDPALLAAVEALSSKLDRPPQVKIELDGRELAKAAASGENPLARMGHGTFPGGNAG